MKRQILCTALVVTACSGRAGELRPAGSEGGPCYGNDTCDAGLSCSGSGEWKCDSTARPRLSTSPK